MRKNAIQTPNELHVFRNNNLRKEPKYGHTLTNYLKKYRITQQHLATTLGVTREVVAHWCLRSYNPSLYMAVRINILTQGRVGFIQLLTKKQWKRLTRDFAGIMSKIEEINSERIENTRRIEREKENE